MIPGMSIIQKKGLGDYKINLIKPSSEPDKMALTIWSKRLNQEVYSTGMMNKGKAQGIYNALNSEPKVMNYLKNKTRLSPSMMKMNW